MTTKIAALKKELVGPHALLTDNLVKIYKKKRVVNEVNVEVKRRPTSINRW